MKRSAQDKAKELAEIARVCAAHGHLPPKSTLRHIGAVDFCNCYKQKYVLKYNQLAPERLEWSAW